MVIIYYIIICILFFHLILRPNLPFDIFVIKMATLDDVMKLLQQNTTSMNDGFKDMKDEMSQMKTDMKDFKTEIKKTVDDSLRTTNDKVQMLETKLQEKDDEIESLRKQCDLQKRQNNVVLFNVPENENSFYELMSIVVNLVSKNTNIAFSDADLNDVYRIGKKGSKCRPILVSLVSHIKLKAMLADKSAFRKVNIGLSQDFPKAVNDERKRLQPMVTELNQAGKKAVLRMDELFVEGEKWDKELIEVEMNKFNARGKRHGSPMESQSTKRVVVAKLSKPPTNQSNHSPIASTNQSIDPTIPASSPSSTPARMFPMFKGTATNVLSPVPGGSHNDKSFTYISK